MEVREEVEWRSETVWSQGRRLGGMEVRDRVAWRSETEWKGGQRQAEARSETVLPGLKQMRVKKAAEAGVERPKTGRSGEGGNRQ